MKIRIIILKGLLLSFLLITNIFNIFAQKRDSLRSYFASYHLDYSPPELFSDLDSYTSVHLNTRYNGQTMLNLSQINNSSDIIIAYNLNPWFRFGNSDDEIKAGLFSNRIRSEADVSKNKINFLDKKRLSIINANDGAEYDFFIDPAKSYHNLKKCIVRIIYRDSVGAASVYYFYNSENEDKVKAVMKKTQSVLKFKLGPFTSPFIVTGVDAGQ